ncbi:MAG: hypothetical protein H6816_02645 [Phycisphaerales bacterium]|nr:hypothetical protein [Phycisphaerales bacterium]
MSLMLGGDRRMEADSYLSSGFGIRRSIEAKKSGWRRVGDVARVWMPGRLKGIQVASDVGTPFLAATQVFDLRPIPRKWLALARTYDSSSRFVKSGQILVTCSGSVGRTTLAYAVHEDTLISHDLLRVDPFDDEHKGWMYAFLHSPQAKAMALGSHYGHIIKHLETSHLELLPICDVDDAVARRFNDSAKKVIALRNRAYERTLKAETLFEKAVGPIAIHDWGTAGFVLPSVGALMNRRRRLEAATHNPGARHIRRHLEENGNGFCTIADAGYDVWLPGRFRRVASEAGVPLLDTSALGAINPSPTRVIKDGDFGDPYRGRVCRHWILMPRSGQVYGILGTPTLALQSWESWVISDDALRIKPRNDSSARSGYMLTALGHPTLGRPLVKAIAYGSSIPHIDPDDLSNFHVVRLNAKQEGEIADLAEAAATARSDADVVEQEMGAEAGEIIEEFVQGN